MGLDQYAYITEAPINKLTSQYDDVNPSMEFYWRKHSRLQEFMEQLWEKKTNTSSSELNCNYMELDTEDLEDLEQAVKTSFEEFVSGGGFFYGHQYQEEAVSEYKKRDEEFVELAKKALVTGYRVYYSCWW